MKILLLSALLTMSCEHLHCQDLAFEVASITPCAPGTPQPASEHSGIAQFTFPGGRFNARATTLAFLMEWAYGIQPSQHVGGPDWMSTDRYDIAAKAEEASTTDQMKRMVQTLLAERFKLKFHHETRPIFAYVISLGKSAPKLTLAQEDETYSMRMAAKASPDQKSTTYHVTATRFTLAQLSDVFARQLGRPMVNKTGLNGEYNFSLDLTTDESRPNFLDPSLLMSALREQLGLTLTSEKVPVDVLVIDGAEKVLGGN